MPVDYRIDKSLGVVFCSGWGVITDEEMIANQRAIASDLDFDPRYRQLADGRKITKVNATTTGIRQLVAGNPFGRGARRAFVVENDTFFGLSRMFELARVAPQDEFRVFRSMDEAREWLHLPVEETAPTKP